MNLLKFCSKNLFYTKNQGKEKGTLIPSITNVRKCISSMK